MVLKLTVEGPTTGGTYHCAFEAPLSEAPGADGPLEIGPSQVTSGNPPTCTPGVASEVALLPDGRLSRVNDRTVTYTKSG